MVILYPSVLGKGSLFLMFASSSEGGHQPRRLELLVDSPPVPKKRVVREVRSATNQGGGRAGLLLFGDPNGFPL